MSADKGTSWVTNLVSEAASRTSTWTSSKRAYAQRIVDSGRLNTSQSPQVKIDPHLQPSWPRPDRS